MSRRQLLAATLVLSFLGAMVRIPVVFSTGLDNGGDVDFTQRTDASSSSPPHRKLLLLSPEAKGRKEPEKLGEKCRRTDIAVSQANTEPLPSGIPTFKVEITNECETGCPIWNIHFNCGWFSSATLIKPNVFKRIRYDLCLVNGGTPLPFGESLSFQYANSYPYSLSVFSLSC
ncbi:PREDICTED: protein TAPETUM DETERMINANT 1-like [Tarenaya hassleriana]|uniref:protein TAPETUM DETERMINANT 1-like n=1 Tax=Tarenaya hassleriana TaxID=28532 RepID=UPI00053C1E60|nr:PREDICTED: protein TAPETUM DETERMINANT 1-like [Tarenaya hassleriana]